MPQRPWFVLLVAVVAGSDADWALTLVDTPALKCGGGQPFISLRMESQEDWTQQHNPYVISVFRTSPQPVTLGLEMRDADGYLVFAYHEVLLADLSEHRNANDLYQMSSSADFQGSTCEDFFLSDGRDPVELPDTFREARDAFRNMCEAEAFEFDMCEELEERAFIDYPTGEAALESDGALCQSLFRHGAVFMPAVLGQPYQFRRLKGGYTSPGGKPPAGGRTFMRGSKTYGVTQTRLSRNYPLFTPISTPYGYAGRGGHAPYRNTSKHTVARGLVVGAVVFGGASGLGGSYNWSRYVTRQFGKGLGNSTAGECPPDNPCDFELAEGEDLTRDDLMTTTAFALHEYQGPFELRVRMVDGWSFEAGRICPPESWTGMGDSSWTLPDQQDLFVAITPVDLMSYEEQEESWSIPWWVVFVVVGGLVCTCVLITSISPKSGGRYR